MAAPRAHYQFVSAYDEYKQNQLMSIGIARSYIISAHEHLKPSHNLSTHKKPLLQRNKKTVETNQPTLNVVSRSICIACIALICFLSNDNDNKQKVPIEFEIADSQLRHTAQTRWTQCLSENGNGFSERQVHGL